MRFVVFGLYYPISNPVSGELAPRHGAGGNGSALADARTAGVEADERSDGGGPERTEIDGGDQIGPAVPLDEDPDAAADDGSYEFLGMIAPEIIRLQARSGSGGYMAMESARAGLYRPQDFRAAPWSGLAYDPAPPDGHGLYAGSRVLTMRGEVPVEDLRPSDRVLGLRGPRMAGIAWIGRCANGAARGDSAPVRIRASALGADLPSRDIVVGPNQVVFPDGSLPITARDLVQQGLAEHAPRESMEMFQVALKPYAGAEDGDVILVDGIFAASRLAPEN